jgi:hypothetical protein
MISKIQGILARKLFSGLSNDPTIKKLYGESPELFSKIIRDTFPKGEYTLVDLGSHEGEFLIALLNNLKEYDFHTTAVEVNKTA